MKTRYKILIIVLVVSFIYWPGIPLLHFGCTEITSNEICFDIARLRVPNPIPSSGVWDTGD